MKDTPEILQKKFVHRGFFDLRIDTLKRAGQDPITYTVVETKVDAVCVLAKHKEKYLIIKEYRHGVEKYILSLPGGRMEKGENPEASAKRELLEETGYIAQNMHFMGKYSPLPSICDQTIFLFYAENCTFEKEPSLDAYEFIETTFYEKDALVEEIKKGADIDGILTASLFFILNTDVTRQK